MRSRDSAGDRIPGVVFAEPAGAGDALNMAAPEEDVAELAVVRVAAVRVDTVTGEVGAHRGVRTAPELAVALDHAVTGIGQGGGGGISRPVPPGKRVAETKNIGAFRQEGASSRESDYFSAFQPARLEKRECGN